MVGANIFRRHEHVSPAHIISSRKQAITTYS
jgi:hypothetical protein